MRIRTTIFMTLPLDGDGESVPEKVVSITMGRSCNHINHLFCLDLAREVLWLTVASLLATFDIGNPVDKEGKPLDPHDIDAKYTQRPVRWVFQN